MLAVFSVELSGIGDNLFFASESGGIRCNDDLNKYLSKIANIMKTNFLLIPISLSDYLSVNFLGFKGTVLGAIPFVQGKNYLEDLAKSGFSKEIYPQVWKNNHTTMDNFFSIHEKSLDLVYNFIVEAIKNLELIN